MKLEVVILENQPAHFPIYMHNVHVVCVILSSTVIQTGILGLPDLLVAHYGSRISLHLFFLCSLLASCVWQLCSHSAMGEEVAESR